MVLIYGECRNAVVAMNLYAQRFLNRRHPSDMIFKRLERKLRINWPLRNRRRQRTARSLENELRVIASVAENPQIDHRSVAREVGISQTSVCCILRENKFHPYHVQLLQELKETDFERRLDFYHFIRTQMQVDNNFIQKILFSDKAKFFNNGSVNKQKCHYYAQENPLWIRETHFQQIVSVNVLCGGSHNWAFFSPRKFDG
jgi:hypothetical protein